jgi:hypothetical protein
MSGYNTRKIYDNCYTVEFIDQQVNPAKYRTLDEFAEIKGKCHALNGPRANKSRSTGELGNTSLVYRTDVESQLFNLDVPDSRCITLNTMNEKNERLKRITDKQKTNYSVCDKNQDYKYSRLDIPVNNFRSVEINRFSYPIIDPKEFVYYGTSNTEQVGNQRFGVNTQLQAKDKVMKPNMNPNSQLTK